VLCYVVVVREVVEGREQGSMVWRGVFWLGAVGIVDGVL